MYITHLPHAYGADNPSNLGDPSGLDSCTVTVEGSTQVPCTYTPLPKLTIQQQQQALSIFNSEAQSAKAEMDQVVMEISQAYSAIGNAPNCQTEINANNASLWEIPGWQSDLNLAEDTFNEALQGMHNLEVIGQLQEQADQEQASLFGDLATAACVVSTIDTALSLSPVPSYGAASVYIATQAAGLYSSVNQCS